MRRRSLGAAVVASLLPGIVGISAGVLAASLLMAYASSALPCCTRSRAAWAAAPFMLGGIYAAVFVFGWPVLVLSPARASPTPPSIFAAAPLAGAAHPNPQT